ncbi:MFS transporter [Vacuolonema iberomarrocanum]|uniref:MFS transporter n=1 Tax=Vacuolonema iberomarrocanum TaxID=3454632 RepID=UPI0019DB8292|nr:MFS transporter [filamentous cyanobacterium LEGE 07170]
MSPSTHKRLPLGTQFAYGIGIFSVVMPDVIMAIFFLYFLTDIVGLRPALAGTVILIGRLWDAVNDLLVGWLSDRTRSIWGRRYPWLVMSVLPLAIFLGLLWWVPPTNHQIFLFAYYCLIVMLYDLALTAVGLPYYALAAELTQDYRDRTRLISFQSFFRTGGIILVMLLAQIIFARVSNPQQQYWALALLCGAMVILAVGLCVSGTYRQYQVVRQPSSQSIKMPIEFWPQIKRVVSDAIFWRVAGIYLGSWLSIQIQASVVPYFVILYLGQTETAVTTTILLAQVAGLLMVMVWGALGQRLDKHHLYLVAIPLWVIAQVLTLLLQPGQIGLFCALMILAGSGAAAAYIVPWAMLPDVIDHQDLQSGQRSEGMYYGIMVWLQKLGVAIALFVIGIGLDWAGFVSAADGTNLPQPPAAILTIRGIMGLVPAVLLIGSLLLAYRYPITRQIHTETQLILNQRGESKDNVAGDRI